MRAGRIACIVLAAAAMAAPAYAQTLAEVARKEEARRAGVKAPSKVYSNADLKPGEVNLAGIAAAEKDPANAELTKKEPAFRSAAQALRERIEKAQAEITAMSATAADQNRSAAERGVAAQRVADRQTDLASLEKQWLKLEKDAEKMAIPREWLEPVPQLPSRQQ